MKLRTFAVGVSLLGVLGVLALSAQRGPGGPGPGAALEPFVGVTTDGTPDQGLFAIRATGVSTRPVMDAAVRFVTSLTPAQRTTTTFAVDDSEWRRWNNVHRAARAGISFGEMTNDQQARAFELLKSALSAKGLEKTRNVMRLNHTIAEITNNFTEYGEGLYNLVVFGEPSTTEPWGWQLEGHHLIVNYFVLGDQVVMTPTFMGSEPVVATAGKYAGTRVLQEEQDKGLLLMRALRPDQAQRATIEAGAKTANRAQTQAYNDNARMPYAGIKAADLDAAQKKQLVDLVSEYVGNMPEGHAKVKMAEVLRHIDDTWFAWIGETKGPRRAGRQHIHSVVRTPNGNDYGRDLLRLHYEQHAHDAGHGHIQSPR